MMGERTDTTEQPAWIPGMAYATQEVPSVEIIDTRPREEQIKARQLAYMTAACMWFALLMVALVVGSFVLRFVATIL